MKPSKAAMQAAEGVLAHLGHDQATHHYRATLLPSIASIIDAAIKPLVDAARNYFALESERERMRREYPAGTCNAEDAWRDFGRHEDAVEKALRTALANFKQGDK